jgi:hypothetical protein
MDKVVFSLSVNVFGPLEPIEFALEQLRKYYPNHQVFVFELVSDKLGPICDRLKCKRVRRDENIYDFSQRYCRFIDFPAFVRRLDDLLYCIDQGGNDAEWVFNMEPDVLIRGPIEKMPPSLDSSGGQIAIAGCKFSFNHFNDKCRKILEERRTLISDIHSFAGGSIALGDYLRKIKDNLPQVEKLYEAALPHSLHDDLIFSLLAYWFGYEIHDWDQVMEEAHTKDVKRRLMAPIVHGFKYYYKV